jgi:hypothetical protein
MQYKYDENTNKKIHTYIQQLEDDFQYKHEDNTYRSQYNRPNDCKLDVLYTYFGRLGSMLAMLFAVQILACTK